MDLITLYKNKNFNFRRAMKHALHAYIEKTPFFFYPPPSVPNACDVDFKSCYRINVDLDEKEDADIIAFFDVAVRDRMRNAISKTILRGCMIGTYAYAMVNDDIDRQQNDAQITAFIENNYSMWTPPLRGKRSQKAFKKIKIQDEPKEQNDDFNKQDDKTNKDKTLKNKTNTNKKKKQNKPEDPKVIYVDQSGCLNDKVNSQQNIETDEDFDLFGSLDAMLQ